jgi:hypothetical protein
LRQLDAAATRGRVLINAIAYAEFSIGYTHIEDVDRVFAGAGLDLIVIPRAALFLAGKVFQRYRTRVPECRRIFSSAPSQVSQIAFVDTRPLQEVLFQRRSHRAA